MRNGGPAAAIAQEELDRTTCPEGVEHVYGWFLELSARRGFGPGGAFALSFADIDAWQRVRGVTLLARELEWILALDRRWFRPEKAEGE